MKNNLSSYDWIVTQGNLWDSKQIDLKDIDGRTYSLLNFFTIEKELVKREREQIAQEVQRLLGK
jgi:hypothetical protein